MIAELDITDTDPALRVSGVSGVVALGSGIDVPLLHLTDERVVPTEHAKADELDFKVNAHIPGIVKPGFPMGSAGGEMSETHGHEPHR